MNNPLTWISVDFEEGMYFKSKIPPTTDDDRLEWYEINAYPKLYEYTLFHMQDDDYIAIGTYPNIESAIKAANKHHKTNINFVPPTVQ